MYDIIRLIFGISIIFVIGMSLLKLVIRDKTKIFLSERIALSYGLGTGALSIGMFLLSFMDFQLNLSNILILFSPFFVYLLWHAKYKVNYSSPDIITKLKNLNFLQLILIASILFIVFLVFFDALIQPMHLQDERGFWALKAKILYHDTTIYSTDFFDADRIHPHKHYPLLIPLIESWIYIALGHIDDRLVKILFPLFFASLLLILYSSQRKFFPETHSLIFTALLASMPYLVVSHLPVYDAGKGAASGYADVPLSFFYFISTIYLYMWMKDHDRKDYLIIASIFSIFTIFTKLEGFMLFIINLSIFIMYVLFNIKYFTKQKIKESSIYPLLPFVILLPWFIFQRNLPNDFLFQFTIENFIQHLYRLPIILIYFLKIFLNPIHWNILWILLSLSTLFTIKDTFKKPIIYLFLMLLLHLLAYLFIYTISPSSSVISQMHYSVDRRVLAHIVPVIVFLISTQTFVGKLLPKITIFTT